MADSLAKMFGVAIANADAQIKGKKIQQWKTSLETSLGKIESSRDTLLAYQQIVKNAQGEEKNIKKLREIRAEVTKEWNQEYENNIDYINNTFLNYADELTYLTIEEMQDELMANTFELYEKINLIRQELSGEEVKYQVVLQYYGNIVEGTYTLKELAPYLVRDLTKEGDYTLKFENKTALAEKLFKLGQDARKKNVKKTIDLKNPQLYNTIKKFFKNNKKKTKIAYNDKGESKIITIGNEGNFYEVYRYILSKNEQGYLGDRKEDIEQNIVNAFAEVQAGGGSEGAFYKGGDVGTLQVKGFIGSSPSFFNSTATVIKAAKKLINEFKSLLEEQNAMAATNIINFLTNQKTEEKVKENIMNMIIKKI